jgi:hypothetical protein
MFDFFRKVSPPMAHVSSIPSQPQAPKSPINQPQKPKSSVLERMRENGKRFFLSLVSSSDKHKAASSLKGVGMEVKHSHRKSMVVVDLKEITANWKTMSSKQLGFRSNELRVLDKAVESFNANGDAKALLAAVNIFAAQKPKERAAAVFQLKHDLMTHLEMKASTEFEKAGIKTQKAVEEHEHNVLRLLVKDTQSFVDTLKHYPHVDLTGTLEAEWKSIQTGLESLPNFQAKYEALHNFVAKAETRIDDWYKSALENGLANIDKHMTFFKNTPYEGIKEIEASVKAEWGERQSQLEALPNDLKLRSIEEFGHKVEKKIVHWQTDTLHHETLNTTHYLHSLNTVSALVKSAPGYTDLVSKADHEWKQTQETLASLSKWEDKLEAVQGFKRKIQGEVYKWQVETVKHDLLQTSNYLNTLESAPHAKLTVYLQQTWSDTQAHLKTLSFEEQLTTIKDFKTRAEADVLDWTKNVLHFEQAKTTLANTVADSHSRLDRAGDVLKEAEQAFREQFAALHVTIGSQLDFIRDSLMFNVEKELAKSTKKHITKDELKVHVDALKELALEKEYKAVVLVQNNELFKKAGSGWNGGLRTDAQLDALIQKEIKDLASKSHMDPKKLQALIEKSLIKPIEGLVVFSNNQQNMLVSLDVAKNAYASVPRFYKMMMTALTAKKDSVSQMDATHLKSDEMAGLKTQMDTLSNATAAISIQASDHLKGTEESHVWTEDRLKPIVIAAFKDKGLAVPDSDTVDTLSHLTFLRLNEKGFIDENGKVKGEAPTQLDLISHDKHKDSYVFFHKQSPERQTDIKKMSDTVSAKIVGAVQFSKQGGQAREMAGVEAATKQYALQKLDTLTANARLKVAYGVSSFARAANAIAVASPFAQEVNGFVGSSGDTSAKGLSAGVLTTLVSSDMTADTLSQKADSIQTALDTYAKNAAEGLASFASSKTVQEAVIEGTQLAVSLMPYAGEAQAAALLLVSAAQYLKAGHDVNTMRSALSDARQLGDSLTQADLSDPSKKEALEVQVVNMMKLLESKDDQEQALGNLLANALNLAAPGLKLGVFIQEAYNTFFNLGTTDKQELYREAAKSVLTIADGFQNMGSGEPIEKVAEFVRAAKEAKSADAQEARQQSYKVAALAQQAAFLLPNQQQIEEGISKALA